MSHLMAPLSAPAGKASGGVNVLLTLVKLGGRSMGMERLIRSIATVIVTAGLALSLTTSAESADRVRWKMQSAFPSKLSVVGEAAARFEPLMDDLSGGTMKVKFYEPGALVPALECFDSVAKGALESCYTTAGYHTGKIPALAWFTTLPFGPDIGEFMAWLQYGGGDKIYDRIYAEHNLKGLHCTGISPETSGWFKFEVTSTDQFKGLKMRFFGLGALVMQKMGASTQLLAGADIYPALERGVIDATEFSMPSLDESLGFQEIAKYNYFPGWHQRFSLGEFLMNIDQWKALTKQQQAWVTSACGDEMMWSYTRSEALQFGAMKRQQGRGVHLMRWPDNYIQAFKDKWDEVLAEQDAKDPLFKEIHASFDAFDKNYAIWRDMQKMPDVK
jgi:TRAP-type mannitol/chloroaromatic compound transport system substrate-binding protein